jgi:glycosyltransferase involved in cell wall biosynthesis
METLRILWLNWRDITSPAAGGAELYTHQVALRLAREGHEVTLFTSQYPGSPKLDNRDGVEIIRRGTASTVYLEAPMFFHAQSRGGNRYDIIVDAINTVPFFSPLYARGAAIVALLYQLTGEIFLKEFARPVGGLLYALERRSYIPWYMKRVDNVVTLANSNKAELLEVCPGLNHERISVIPPGADHDDFKPGDKSDEPLLLFMNRLVKYKQPDHMITGMKEICKHVPNAKLILVGTLRTGRYVTYLRHLVKVLGLEDRVSFLLSNPFAGGKVSLLQRAWVHVLPSMKEGFGLSILEAAACGTPTVGYDVPGIRDAVIQGKTGVLVQPGDMLSLAKHVTDLLTDFDRLRLLGERATRWAANFTWDDTAQQFMGLLEKGRIPPRVSTES